MYLLEQLKQTKTAKATPATEVASWAAQVSLPPKPTLSTPAPHDTDVMCGNRQVQIPGLCFSQTIRPH